MLKRVKGHGRRATYTVGGSQNESGWYVKLRPGREKDILSNEAKRINWARRETTLPVTVRAKSINTPFVGLLLTKAVRGVPAHHLIDSLGPVQLVQCLSNGMSAFHSVHPNTDFPFTPPVWATDKETSIKHIHDLDELRRQGKRLHSEFDRLSNRKLERIIEQGPERYDQKTFIHGDLCMPNMLMSHEGKLTGLIDLGALHVGDPLLDTALLAWCINDNLGPKWADYFLGLHDLAVDDSRIQFYRLAYDLSLTFPDPWEWTMAPKLVQRRAKLKGVRI